MTSVTPNLKHLLVESGFESLPDQPPYGFWIKPDGSFLVCKAMWEHLKYLQTVAPDANDHNFYRHASAISWVRVVKGVPTGTVNGTFAVLHPEVSWMATVPEKATRASLKTLDDLGSWYGMKVFKKPVPPHLL